MRSFMASPGIRLNDGDENFIEGLADEARLELEGALRELTHLDPKTRSSLHSDHWLADLLARQLRLADMVVANHDAGRLALSPQIFTTTADARLASPVVNRLLEGSSFAREVRQALEAQGINDFIERRTNRQQPVRLRRLLAGVVASLVMSVSGASSFKDLTPEIMEAWLRYFKDESGHRWNPEVWGAEKELAYQCLREVGYAYARATGAQGVARLTKQARSDRKRPLVYWVDFATALEPVPTWLESYKRWRSISPTLSTVYRQTFMHLARWIVHTEGDAGATGVAPSPASARDEKPPAPTNAIAGFLSEPRPGRSFADHMLEQVAASAASVPEGCPDGKSVISYLSIALRYSEWAADDLGMTEQGLPVHHLVTSNDLEKAKNLLRSGGVEPRPAEAVSRDLPARYYKMTREILEEGESGWPGRCGLFLERVGTVDIYCPVLPTLFLSLFHLPLRVGQMKRLDSGEGDVTRFDCHRLEWGTNTGPNAGYWRRSSNPLEDRGYAFRFPSDPPITGFAVNTNKTGKPYVIPWQNEILHPLLYDLRLWQETHNRSVAPVGPELYVDNVERAEEGKLGDYPQIFPLFRLPVDTRSGKQGAPPNARRTNEFWQQLMAELERRWNEQHPSDAPIRIVKRQEKTGQAYGAWYNPHGLRVAGLTLMLHAKVPIEIISKLIAGHATILMTLYYMRLDPAAVHAALEDGKSKAESALVAAHLRDLKNLKFEAAQRRSACVSDEGLRTAVGMSELDKALWSDTGIGFCPYNGERCHDGGGVLRRSRRSGGQNYDTHAPVEGGTRNCIMCRHFVSGVAWRIPLWAYGNKLWRGIAIKSQRITVLEAELEELRCSTGETSPRPPGTATRIDQHQLELDALRVEQQLLGKAVFNTIRLLEACDEVERRSAEDGEAHPGALAPVAASPQAVAFAEGSEFVQAALVTAAGRLYPVLHDGEAEASRNRFVDAITWHNWGRPLSMIPMDAAAMTRCQDEMCRLLLQRVSHEQADALVSGTVSLRDLRLGEEAVAVLPAAVGKGIRLGPGHSFPQLPGIC